MSALRVSDFGRLWLAGLMSTAGDSLLLASLPIVVYHGHGVPDDPSRRSPQQAARRG
jgi:hypothetical protein